MMLLLDVGNSRVKWRLVGRSVHSAGIATHAALGDLAATLETPSITRVLGSNVAGDEIATTLSAMVARRGLSLEWIVASAERCGVTNLYTHPTQLGVDRWAALIGARARHPRATLVVMAGTATTIDMLAANGHFLGGLILPGVHLMRQALAANTAQLGGRAGRLAPVPRNTADAIFSGCLHAQAGAIERMFRQLQEPYAKCLLSGGGADDIAPLLDIAVQRVDNLVLDGLLQLARET
ncbi:type III pantothenate kinase [Betaproteobacteria bacterium]|nr:type III pantothenate kinase [Betaproteobacteria bacterium]GHU26992.1 type III pantothenate kinase [Betaproteobacteria bacterium]